MIIEVSEDNFEEEIINKSKEKPVVVDFWSPFCSPCLILGPILEKLSEEYGSQFVFTKVNVDENIILAQRYNITGVPTVKVFKGGEAKDEFVGSLPELLVRQWLDKNIDDKTQEEV